MPSKRQCRIFGSDPDTLLAYSTPAIVSIRDWRLGCMKYLLMLMIGAYIFVWQLLRGTTYLVKEDPTGVIRFSIQQPTKDQASGKPGCDPLDEGCLSTFRPLNQLEYCTQANVSSRSFQPYKCRFWGSIEDATIFQSSAIFASRVTEYEQVDACQPSEMVCDRLWNNTKKKKTYFVADIESYTILFDHTVVAPNLGISGGSRQSQGYLRSSDEGLCKYFMGHNGGGGGKTVPDPQDGKGCLIPPNSTSNGLDIITLETLLAADGINLEMGSALNNHHSIRYNGAVVLVQINYKNFKPWTFNNPKSKIEYTYDVTVLTDTTAKNVKSFYEGSGFKTRVVQNGHGIRIVVVQTGQLAAFDGQALLLTLTASLTLLALANTVVDNLAMYVLPQKALYRSFKYKVTPDFSDYLAEMEGGAEKDAESTNSRIESKDGGIGGMNYSALQ